MEKVTMLWRHHAIEMFKETSASSFIIICCGI